MRTRTIIIEGPYLEVARELALAKFDSLYDDGYMNRVKIHGTERIEFSFTNLGNYIGPFVPSDTLEEISG